MTQNTFTKFTNYTVKELESYVADPNACVQKLEWINHVCVLPKYLGNICEGVKACLTQKIGKYDREVDGIILAFKNTKILSPLSTIRPNGVRIHVKVSTNFYVFRPVNGATIKGTIKYVSKNYISAIVYRVFNVTIRLDKYKVKEVKQGREISFVVKSFDIKCDLPFIEGELISAPDEQNVKKEKSPTKSVTVKVESTESHADISDTTRITKKKETEVSPEKHNTKEESDSDDEVQRSVQALLNNIQKEMSDTADSASEREVARTETSKRKKRRKDFNESDAIKQENEPKRVKLNGHNSNEKVEDFKDDMEHSINAILSCIEKEMSDPADSDNGNLAREKSTVSPNIKNVDKKKKRMQENVSESPKKEKKRKSIQQNGHTTEDSRNEYDDVESSIQAILSGLEKQMSDTADSDHGISINPPVKKPTIEKKKKKKSKIDSLEKQLLQKLAAELCEPDENESTETPPEKSQKKKKKKKSKADTDADDFEASIMSILKSAAYADDNESHDNDVARSPIKKASRKSVRFDNTITEASFNTFDSSDLLEISQLQSPALSSTLKGT